jgi:rhodanese-related sulfurtransferase
VIAAPSSREASDLPPNWFPRPALERSPREVAAMLVSGRPPLLIDCRREDERRLAAIDAAIHVPMGETAEWIESLVEAQRDDPATAEQEIVVHCHHGVRSLQVVASLQAAGIAHARSMAGGIDWWSISVDPSVPRY